MALDNECTHVRKNSSTIVDYVIINKYEITSENFKTNKLSDYKVINTQYEQRECVT